MTDAETYTDDEYAEVIRKSYKRPRLRNWLAEGGIVVGGGPIVGGNPFSPHQPPAFPPLIAAAMKQIAQFQRSIR